MSIPIGLTYPALKKLKPCSEGLVRVTRLLGGARKWNGLVITAAEARAAGATFDDLIWAASALALTDNDIDGRVRLFLADCAAHVLHIYENFAPGDTRVRDCITAARQFSRGEIGEAAWTKWATGAVEAADAAWAVRAAGAAVAAGAAQAVWVAEPARAAGAARAAVAERAEERDWQFDRLILWLSDPEPQDIEG